MASQIDLIDLKHDLAQLHMHQTPHYITHDLKHSFKYEL